MRPKSMREAIVCAIALQYPFTLEEVYSAYQLLASYDSTIKACEIARDRLIALSVAAGELSKEEDKERKTCCRSMDQAHALMIVHGNDDCRDGSSWISVPGGGYDMSISFCPFCGALLT